MIKAGRKKLWISVLLVLLVTALTAGFALMFARGEKSAFADESPLPEDEQPNYHVGTALGHDELVADVLKDRDDYDGIYDATTWVGVYGHKSLVYKAVFPETAKTAWIGMSIVGHVTNAKIEVSNDGEDWTEKFVSKETDGVYSLPDDALLIVANTDNTKHLYIDATEFLQKEGPSPIYVRLSVATNATGNELGIHNLLFFEGNVFTAPNTVLGPQDLADTATNKLKQDGWFANYLTLANGQTEAVTVSGAYLDENRYGLWTMAVPAAAKEVSFGTHEQNGNAMQKILVFVNGKKVGEPRTMEHNANNSHVAGQCFDLTADLHDYLGTDFRLTIMVGDNTPADGNGPQIKYLEFNYAIPAAESLSDLLPAGSEDGVIANTTMVDGFNTSEILRGLAKLDKKKVYKNYSDPVKVTEDKLKKEFDIEINTDVAEDAKEPLEAEEITNVLSHTAVFYGSKLTKDQNATYKKCPVFDGAWWHPNGKAAPEGKYVRTLGIFKLHYGANEGLGYLKVPIAGSYLLKVMNGGKATYDPETNVWQSEDEESEQRALNFHYTEGYAAVQCDIKFADVDNEAYTTVASQIAPISPDEHKAIYIDVSKFLNEEGGTLYLFVTDPTLADGNGPQLLNFEELGLYTYSVDNTPFTAEGPEELYIGGPNAEDTVSVSLKTMAEGEGIGSVKIDGEDVGSTEYDATSVKNTVLFFSSLFAEAKTYTVTLISNKNAARTATVSIEVKQDAVSDISVKTQPAKTSYTTGDTLDFAGGKLELTWLSGEKSEIDMTAAGVTASATTAQDTAGTQTVTLTYADKTATVELTITEKTTTEPENPGTTPGEGENPGTTPGEGETPGGTTPGESENPGTTPGDNNTDKKGSGCGGSIAGSSAAAIVLLLMAAVTLLAVGAYVVRKK